MIYTPLTENIAKIGTPDQLAKWVKGLRSGDYIQIGGRLHRRHEPNSACCLGVACVVVSGSNLESLGGVGLPEGVFGSGFSVNAQEAHIAQNSTQSRYRPSDLNDGANLTFDQIADLLEGKTVDTGDN